MSLLKTNINNDYINDSDIVNTITWNNVIYEKKKIFNDKRSYNANDCSAIVSATRSRNINHFKNLCDTWAGSNILNEPDNNDELLSTPLMIAVKLNNLQYVQELLLSHADISRKNKNGYNAIHIATQDGFIECLSFLITFGYNNIDDVTTSGMTACNIAANFGKDECLRLLIEHHADINKPNKNGYTPINNASESGKDSCVKLLIDANADINHASLNLYTPICTAALMGKDVCLELLLNANADPKRPCNTGATPLYLAAQNGKANCLKLLIDKKVDINTQRYDGNTPLYAASSFGRDICVDILASNKANLNIQNKMGRTAIFAAAYAGHIKCVDILIANGADVNKADNDFWTPLSIAKTAKSTEHTVVVNSLVKCGAINVEPPSYDMDSTLLEKEKTQDEANVDEMKIQTMYKMVDECKVSANGKEVVKKVLYLTNKQALLFDDLAMGRCIQALDIGDPKFVIKLLPSLGIRRSQMKLAHPEWFGLPESEYGFSTMSSSEINESDERALETQVLLFMKSCILPLAKQTRALVLVSGANDCYFSASLASVALTEQARLGKDCPFTVIATASEGEVHSRAVSPDDQGSIAAQVLKGCRAWRKRVVTMNSFYSGEFLREGKKMERCDLTASASRYIIFEDFDESTSSGGVLNAGPRRAFESVFLQHLTRKLPSIAIQAFNVGEGLPFVSDLLSRNVPVIFLDASERAVTMSSQPVDENPATHLARESSAFPSLSKDEFSKIRFDNTGITAESRFRLLSVAFEMYVRKYETLIKYGKIDTQDASTVAFFHSSLLIGSRMPKWLGKVPLHLRIKEMESLRRLHKDTQNAATVKLESAVRVIEFLQSKGIAMQKKAELSKVQLWVKTHDKQFDHLMSLAMNTQRTLQALCSDIDSKGGLITTHEIQPEGWLSLFEVLTSANTYSASFYDVEEIKSILGSIAKIDRLPNHNSLEALQILQDCWDHVEMYNEFANTYKFVTKVSYILMLLIGMAITTLCLYQAYRDISVRIPVMILAFFGSALASFVTFTNPAVKWHHLRSSALSIESEVWAFRTRAGPYRTTGEGFDDSSERHLAGVLKEIKDKVLEGADIKNTSFYGKPPVHYLHGQHEPSYQSTKSHFWQPAQSKVANLPSSEEMKTVDIENLYVRDDSIKLTEVIRRLSQMDMDGLGSEYKSVDSHYEPVQPDQYIEFRVQKALKFYQSRIPSSHRVRNITQFLLVLGSIGSVVLSIIDYPILTAFLSIFAASITAYLEFNGTNSKIQRYSSTVHSLNELIIWWRTMPPIDRSVVANVDRLIVTCEELLQREHQAWKSTSQAVRMLQRASTDLSKDKDDHDSN